MATWLAKQDLREAGQEVDIIGEQHVVGEDTPNYVFLNEVPLDAQSTVVKTNDGSVTFTIITAGTPSSNQVRVYFSGRLAGALEFHSSRNGTSITVDYKGRGSNLFARDINRLQTEKLDRDGSIPLTNALLSAMSAAGEVLAGRLVSDTQYRVVLRHDSLLFGPGGSTEPDVEIVRTGANLLELRSDVIITGDFEVQGTTTFLNTNELQVGDNIIVLNASYSGSNPSLAAGIEVERGDLTNARILWDEENDVWKIGLAGSEYTIWHAGNQGPGSGMNADLLDGQHASAFALASHNHDSTYLKLTGGQLTGPFWQAMGVNRTSYRYQNVLAFYHDWQRATGALVIRMPVEKLWSNTMMLGVIRGYNYGGTISGEWEVTFSGYNYSADRSWRNTGVRILGPAPFDNVRLGVEKDAQGNHVRNVVVLGDVDTDWRAVYVAVTEFVVAYGDTSGWESGWEYALVTDLSSFSLQTPPLRKLLYEQDGVAVVSDLCIGKINGPDTGSFPGYGNKLYFSGGPAGSTGNSENSDPLWIARYNVASDQSELHINIGDSSSSSDRFVVGTTVSGTWTPKFTVDMNGELWAGAYGSNKIWHAGNDGSGSGLDADTVDGQHASAFASANHNHDTTYLKLSGGTLTGALTVPSIKAPYNNAYILHDHGNGNVSLSAAGNDLYLGYTNTLKVILSTDLFSSNGSLLMLGADGKLYYQGVDTDSRYVRSDTTNLGKTGNISTITFSTPGEWAALPVGFSRMVNNTTGVAGGAPTNDYGYFFKMANRSTSGGWAGLWVNYSDSSLYVGAANTDTTFASWTKVWTERNDGAGSGLDADLLDGQHASAFAPANHGHTVVDPLTTQEPETGRSVHATGVYSFRTVSTTTNKPGGMNHAAVLGFGRGTSGSAQIAIGWTSAEEGRVYVRSLRDTTDAWWPWRKVYTEKYPPTFAEIASKPTTLSGYGITDAYTKSEADSRYLRLTGGSMTGSLVIKQALWLDDYAGGTGNRMRTGYTEDGSRFYIAPVHGGVPDFNKELSYDFAAARWVFDETPYVASHAIWHAGNFDPASKADVGHNHDWTEVTNKPSYATRWPSWTEVTGKPSTFPPSSHNHDSVYLKLSGGDLTGSLTLKMGADSQRAINIYSDDTANTYWQFVVRSPTSSTETQRNDLLLYRYDGTNYNRVMWIRHSDLVVRFEATPVVGSNAIWHAGNLSKSEFVPASGGTITGNLSVNGDVTVNSGSVTAASFWESSSLSLKQDVEQWAGDALALLRTVEIYEFAFKKRPEERRIGIIADWTHPIFAGPNQDAFNIADSLAVTMRAVQQLDDEVTQLRERIAVLERRIAELERR